MRLIFGLGNPGPEYEFSPHNMGFGVVDRLAARHAVRMGRKQDHALCGRLDLSGREIWLIKPQTMMNGSGLAVRDWLARQDCGPGEILVVADELDLPWGQLRIRQQGGAAGHHGLESVIDSLGTKQFTRLRIGVRPEHALADSVRYLLSPAPRSRREELDAVFDRAADALEAILQVGTKRAMTQYNRRDSSPRPSGPSPEGAQKVIP